MKDITYFLLGILGTTLGLFAMIITCVYLWKVVFYCVAH